MRLMTMPGKIVETSRHTLLIMRDGGRCQAVCVVKDDAIGDIASRLDLIEAIASRKLDDGELAFDGRVWITTADLTAPCFENRH